MRLQNKNVVSGLEGCGKSSQLFKIVETIATRENPVLFGVKNYKLMQEQVNNWSKRFNINYEEFAICGFNMEYEPAREVYTDKEYPFIIPDTARFVFTSQALIQRNRHLEFTNDTTGESVSYSHIIIDEFDFTSGIIPSLDYQLSNLKIEKENIENKILQWIRDTYTNYDYAKVLRKKRNGDDGFTLAHWISNCKCPLTFLTSERLATRLLKLFGFNEIEIPSPDFKDCKINVWSNKYIGRTFFAKMNQYVGWNKIHNELGYDLIISDCINSYYENNKLIDETLDISVISHTSIRGSNDWIDSKILTVLSYIPSQVIKEVKDAFKYFGDDIEYHEVEKLFYRDRLCQAVGRVIGNRGSKETDLIINSSMWDKIKEYDEIPYSFNDKWDFRFNGFDNILSKVEETEQKIKDNQSKKYAQQRMNTYQLLDELFKIEVGNYILVSDVKEYLKKWGVVNDRGSAMSATKVAKYFGSINNLIRIKNKRIDKNVIRVIENLTFVY